MNKFKENAVTFESEEKKFNNENAFNEFKERKEKTRPVTKSKSKEFIRFQESEYGIDKIVQRQNHTSAGKGGSFKFHYSNEGNVHANLKLDNYLLSNNRLNEISTVKDEVKAINNTDINDPQKFIDDSAIAAFDYIAEKNSNKTVRYKNIKKSANKDIKQLRKELKEERIEQKKPDRRTDSLQRNNENRFQVLEKDYFTKQTAFTKKESLISDRFIETPFVQENKYEFANRKSHEKEHEMEPARSSNKFSNQNGNKSNNRNSMTKSERMEQKKAEKKAAKKGENKSIRKMAAATALKKTIETKKDINSEFMSSGENLSGNALKDSNTGFIKIFSTTVKNMAERIVKGIIRKLLLALGAILSLLTPVLIPVAVILLIIIVIVACIGGGSDSEEDISLYEDTRYSYNWHMENVLQQDEIDAIIEKLKTRYPDFSIYQEISLRFALSKVGMAYDQTSHWDHMDNVFDCSELVYLTCLIGGVDISNDGLYSAAEMCRYCVDNNLIINTVTELKPGDILFYGGADNGRYMGVYHVSIYLGNIDGTEYMIEAYSQSAGVIRSVLRRNKLVAVARVIPANQTLSSYDVIE